MRSSTALLAAFVSAVSATIYVTAPVATTTCTAGTPCNVSWNDDGNAPVLATIGACKIDLCTGGVQQQTCLQNISPSTDVSTIAMMNWNPDPTIGGNGNMWFVKYTSLTYKDPANPTFPFTAYSAKFTLAGMTGTFNSTVQSEINGAATGVAVSTAPAASTATTSVALSPTGSSVMQTIKPSSTGTSTHSSTAASATAKKNGAAGPITAPGVVSGVTGAAGFMSFLGVFFGMLAFGL